MVYVEAAKKTGGFMVLAVVLGLAVATLTTFSEDTVIIGHVTEDVALSSTNWIVFAIGVFIGAIVLGTYVYLAKIEARRDE